MICKLKDIPGQQLVKFQRAGIVPYKKECDRLIFVLGIDRKSGDVSNFGGSIRDDEECVKGAMREFMEESHECFGVFNANSLENCITIYNDTEIIIFLCSEWEDKDINYRFEQKKRINSEMESLFICDDQQLLRILTDQQSERIMYHKVKDLFMTVTRRGFFF